MHGLGWCLWIVQGEGVGKVVFCFSFFVFALFVFFFYFALFVFFLVCHRFFFYYFSVFHYLFHMSRFQFLILNFRAFYVLLHQYCEKLHNFPAFAQDFASKSSSMFSTRLAEVNGEGFSAMRLEPRGFIRFLTL